MASTCAQLPTLTVIITRPPVPVVPLVGGQGSGQHTRTLTKVLDTFFLFARVVFLLQVPVPAVPLLA